MNTKKFLWSIGAAIASTKIAHAITDLGVDDMLRPVGLSRRRTHIPENLAFLGVGIVIGGVAALLLAPTSGEEARARISRKVDELGDAASKKVREVRDEVEAMRPRIGNSHSAHEPA
jgi:hypothetical protein